MQAGITYLGPPLLLFLFVLRYTRWLAWTRGEAGYKVGATVQATVVQVSEHGVLARLPDGLSGHVHLGHDHGSSTGHASHDHGTANAHVTLTVGTTAQFIITERNHIEQQLHLQVAAAPAEHAQDPH